VKTTVNRLKAFLGVTGSPADSLRYYLVENNSVTLATGVFAAVGTVSSVGWVTVGLPSDIALTSTSSYRLLFDSTGCSVDNRYDFYTGGATNSNPYYDLTYDGVKSVMERNYNSSLYTYAQMDLGFYFSYQATTPTLSPTNTRTRTSTPTVTRTPTITATPTVTLTPTITMTAGYMLGTSGNECVIRSADNFMIPENGDRYSIRFVNRVTKDIEAFGFYGTLSGNSPNFTVGIAEDNTSNPGYPRDTYLYQLDDYKAVDGWNEFAGLSLTLTRAPPTTWYLLMTTKNTGNFIPYRTYQIITYPLRSIPRHQSVDPGRQRSWSLAGWNLPSFFVTRRPSTMAIPTWSL
jgi:hypothetical protein